MLFTFPGVNIESNGERHNRWAYIYILFCNLVHTVLFVFKFHCIFNDIIVEINEAVKFGASTNKSKR